MRPPLVGLFTLSLLVAASAPALASSDEERAAELFRESAEAYRAGALDRAIELLEEAYRLAGDPVLLYNLAKAYESKGDFARAIALYGKYLAEAPEIQDRGAIERRIATLQTSLAEREKLEAEARAAEERAKRAEAERREESASPVPWIVAGAGAAGLAAGVLFGVVAKGRQDDAVAEPVQLAAADIAADASGFATAANVCFIVGGTLFAAGVTWGVIDLASTGDGGEPGDVALRLEPATSTLRAVVVLD